MESRRGHVQSYLWSIATDFVGPPIPFRLFNAFASLAFLDSARYSIVYRMVKTSLNLFRTLFRSSSLSIVFQIENRSVGSRQQISNDIFCQRRIVANGLYRLEWWQATELIPYSFYNLDSKQEIDRSSRYIYTFVQDPTKHLSNRLSTIETMIL